jgi:molybdate transport system substrate-binding protein
VSVSPRHLPWSRFAFTAAIALALTGCGRPAPKPPPERVSLTLYLPCVISSPMRKVITSYTAAHPEVEIWDTVTKPLALTSEAKGEQLRPAVVVTMGDLEMDSLVKAGIVARQDVHDIVANSYALAVIVPAKDAGRVHQLSDLAGAAVKRIQVEDPAISTLGDRARSAFEKLGLWTSVAPKVVHFDPDKNVVDQLLSGKADAAVVFKDCLFSEGAAPPKTVRLAAQFPADAYAPITYQAAAVKAAPQPEVAREFVDFLRSPGGQEALQRAGLTPAQRP